MAHQGCPSMPYHLPNFVPFDPGGLSLTPRYLIAPSSPFCRVVFVARGGGSVVGALPWNCSQANEIKFRALASMHGSPLCGPSGTLIVRNVLNVPSPIQPVGSIPIWRWTPATPVSPTLPLLPCENPFENARSNAEAGPCHLCARQTVRLYASTSGPSADGVFPFASGG